MTIQETLRSYRLCLGGRDEQVTGHATMVEVPIVYLLEAADRVDKLEWYLELLAEATPHTWLKDEIDDILRR
jgi:hypothetical protein